MEQTIDKVIEQPMPFLAFLDRPDDSPWSEYADGRAVMSPTPDRRHALILANLHLIVHAVCPPDQLTLFAPFDWLLWTDPDGRVRQPDFFVVRRATFETVTNQLLDPPVLAVEVISRWSRRLDLVTKPAEYVRAGCMDIWTIDPEGPTIHIFDGRSGQPVETAVVSSDQELRVETPFPITLHPSELLKV